MREMKDSGVEWIGEIPATWNIRIVKNLFNITRGRVIAKTEIEDNPLDSFYPVYSSQTANNGVLGYISSFDYAVDSLTWTTDGAKAGTVFLRRGKYSITNVCGILTPKTDDCLLEYLYYAVGYSSYNCRRADINGFKIMSNEMAVIPIAIPSVAEQKRISAFLLEQETKVSALIANVQAQIEKLKAYKQSLITEVVTKGLDPTVPMKDSGVEWIGEVPEQWLIVPSKFLFANCDERRRDNDVQLTASQKYGMISQEEYMFRENARIVLADKGLESWKHIEPFDFVISLRSFQGGLEMSEVTGCATWRYIVLRARQRIHPYYYKWLFKSSMYITALQKTCNYIRDGQDLRYSNFVKVPLCIPTIDEQQRIAAYLDEKCAQIDRLIALKQAKIEKLEQYKRSLIYEYVTGKREVS